MIGNSVSTIEDHLYVQTVSVGLHGLSLIFSAHIVPNCLCNYNQVEKLPYDTKDKLQLQKYVFCWDKAKLTSGIKIRYLL